jgi:hypothetical protein
MQINAIFWGMIIKYIEDIAGINGKIFKKTILSAVY